MSCEFENSGSVSSVSVPEEFVDILGMDDDGLVEVEMAVAGLLFIMKWLEDASGARLMAEDGLCLKSSLMFA